MSIAPVPAYNAIAKPAAVSDTKASRRETHDDGTRVVTNTKDKPFSFWDLVDIVNPLQHIPVVSTFYRKLTGDEIGNFARVAGGALYGGLAGAAVGGINALMVTDSGKDIGDTVLSYFDGSKDPQPYGPATPVTGAVTPTIPDADTASANAPAGAQGALFDYARPGATAGKPALKEPEPVKPIPVIEVHPPKEAAAKGGILPATEAVSGLPDLMPGAGTPDVSSALPSLPDKNDKKAVQHAMMDALLKMQSLHEDDKSNSSRTAISDDLTASLN